MVGAVSWTVAAPVSMGLAAWALRVRRGEGGLLPVCDASPWVFCGLIAVSS